MAAPWSIYFFACNREMQPFSFFFLAIRWGGGGGGGLGSGSGSKFNCAARVGSGWVRQSRVRAGFGLQFWARADLYLEYTILIAITHLSCGRRCKIVPFARLAILNHILCYTSRRTLRRYKRIFSVTAEIKVIIKVSSSTARLFMSVSTFNTCTPQDTDPF